MLFSFQTRATLSGIDVKIKVKIHFPKNKLGERIRCHVGQLFI